MVCNARAARGYCSIAANPNEIATDNSLLPTTLNPLFLTGFSDAESTFSVTILKNNALKAG